MLQFSIYKDENENDTFWNKYYNTLRPKLANAKGNFSSSLVDEFTKGYRNDLRQIPRIALILARFNFWGMITDAEFAELVKDDLKSLYPKLKNLDKQELLSCLRYVKSKSLIGVDDESFRAFSLPGSKIIDMPTISHSERLVYTPRFSGFFSIIENILVAQYVASLLDKELVVNDVDNKWWPYPIPFSELFHDTFLFLSRDEVPDDTGVIDFDVMRTLLKEHIDKTPYNADIYSSFKIKRYNEIKTSLRTYLHNKNIELPTGNYTAVFFRGGDKLRQESIIVPPQLVAEDIKLLSVLSDDIYLIGDDYSMSYDVMQHIQYIDCKNLIPVDKKGYELFQKTTNDEVLEIVKNFVILGDARYTLGCPSSNLVNAANWSNESDTYYRTNLKSVPSYRLFLV